MSTLSHSRSIHSAFAAIPSSSSASYASAVSNVLGGRHPPGLGGSSYGGITSVSYSYPNTYPPGVARQQQPRGPGSSRSGYRRTPSPPSRRFQLASISSAAPSTYDPFAESEPEPIIAHHAPVRIRSASRSYPRTATSSISSYSASSPSLSSSPSATAVSTLAFPLVPMTPSSPYPSLASDKSFQSKLVAGILLNRVHAVGKPMRRMPHAGPKTYVRSRLSASTVAVEC